MADQQSHVIIIGAGPAGLATAACLTHHSIPYTILEREDCFASLWKKKTYDHLTLHLGKRFCELPHFPFPKHYPTYVPKEMFIKYIDDYAAHFKINPLYHRRGESADYDEVTQKWSVKVRNMESNEVEEYMAQYMVVATGRTSDPFVPKVDGLDTFGGGYIHSTDYRSGEKYSQKNVLVVGAGNSGSGIALDLANSGAKVTMVFRSPQHIITRKIAYMALFLASYLPVKVIDELMLIGSKMKFGDITKYGMKRPKEGPLTMIFKHSKYAIIDNGTFAKIKTREIQVVPGITSIKGSEVHFANGKSHPFDAIIFATGFKESTNMKLKVDGCALDDEKNPEHIFANNWKGKNGSYFSGLVTRGLYAVGMDARNIAEDIKKHI